MWFLLGTTLTASFFDSLNPSAIAQQMLLQLLFTLAMSRHNILKGYQPNLPQLVQCTMILYPIRFLIFKLLYAGEQNHTGSCGKI